MRIIYTSNTLITVLTTHNLGPTQHPHPLAAYPLPYLRLTKVDYFSLSHGRPLYRRHRKNSLLARKEVNNLRLGKWITYGSTKELQFTRATNNKGYKGKSHALSVFPYFRVTSTQAGTVLTPFTNRVNSVHEPC